MDDLDDIVMRSWYSWPSWAAIGFTVRQLVRRSWLGCIELNSIPQSLLTLFFWCAQIRYDKVNAKLLEGLGLVAHVSIGGHGCVQKFRVQHFSTSALPQFRSEAFSR